MMQLIKNKSNYGAGLLAMLLAVALNTGCATEPVGKNTGGGALIGGGLGAGLGAVAGNNVKGISKTEGAVAGALVGGLLGGAFGNQKDAAERQNSSVNARMNSIEAQSNTSVVNISNANGSTTPVVLHRSGNQWIGPRGESYSNFPTEAQLKTVYGL